MSDFLELDTKALLAVNGGASCSGGSCSSSVSKNTGSCGSSGISYSGSCSSSGGSSYGGSCGTSGGNCGSFGGSCSSYGGSNVETSNGGGGNNDQLKETTPSYNIVGNSYAEVANAKPGDKMKKSEDEYIILTQGDIDWAKAQLEKNATNSESTKTDTELNEIIGVGSCGGGGAVGGSCGGGSVVVKPLVPTPSVSAVSSEDNSTPSPTEPIPNYEDNFVENSDYGVANAKPGDKLKRKDGTIVTLTQGDIDFAKAKLEKEAASNPANEQSNNITPEEVDSVTPSLEDNITDDSTIPSENDVTTNPSVEEPPTSPTEDLTNPKPSGSTSNNNTTPATSSEDKISKSIQENNDKQYNYDTGYRCDNWVEEVLNDAGYDASDYLTAGNSYEKTVQQHIDALTSSKTEGVDYTKTLPTADGAYVVFMDDSSIGYAEHAAILVIENGVATLYDNSSGRGNAFYKEDEAGNVLKDEKGNPLVSYYDQGVASEKVYGKNNGTKLLDYGYDTFYYQKIQ